MTLPAPIVSDPAAQLNFESLNKKTVDLTTNVAALQVVAPTGTVTSLPASPTNGQEIEYLADATNGVVWRFKYRAASASIYKWEFIGGAELIDTVATQQAFTTTVYTAGQPATAGPAITAPLAGDYDVRLEANLASTVAAGAAYMSAAFGATAAIDADATTVYEGSTGGVQVNASRTIRKAGLAASTAIVSKYRVDSGVTGQAGKRLIAVKPVRVG